MKTNLVLSEKKTGATKMDLTEIFEALSYAVMLLNRHTVTFVETPLDEEGNELKEEKTKMGLDVFIIRSFAETLLEKYGKTKEEIEEALKIDGRIYETCEVPTGNPWHIITRGSLQ